MLLLAATNLDISITTRIGAQVDEEGSITIPARLLTDFVNSLPDDRIDIESSSEPISSNIRCRRFEATINGSDVEDFPPLPTVEDGSTIKVNAQILRQAVNRVAFAAALFSVSLFSPYFVECGFVAHEDTRCLPHRCYVLYGDEECTLLLHADGPTLGSTQSI